MRQMLQVSSPEDCIIATGQLHTVGDFARLAFDCVGLDAGKFVRSKSGGAPAARTPICGDAAKLRRITGWVPRLALPQIVEAMVHADLSAIKNGDR